MKKIAHAIHHTHWDLIWYFTVQDADVQFAYNMKELLAAFDANELDHFFLDGQTAPIDDYLRLYPEEAERIHRHVSSGRLVIGPFNSQLDSFITSGESVINNLRLGHKTAERLGKVSKIAYLPDSFGHSIDYPKIFKQFDINDFVITRGVGDEYGLGSEFYLKANDGSSVLVYTMIAGYGYGCYAFKEGTLFSDQAVDYNKIDVHQLIDRLLSYSTMANEFVFPLGFDQNPMVRNVKDRMATYNQIQDEIEFVETTWQAFFEAVRSKGRNIKTATHELISTQYHRVHRSIYSARADVKGLQDKVERVLTYELQPLMTLLDSLGVPYQNGLLDRAWETLILCQTHSSANLTDETNDYIERETKNALNLAYSHKYYLLKLMSISLEERVDEGSPLLVVSTTPYRHNKLVTTTIYSKTPHFNLYHGERVIPYTLIHKERKNNGVLRKDPLKMNEDRFYYETAIQFLAEDMPGIAYRTYYIKEEAEKAVSFPAASGTSIENAFYKVMHTEDGIHILDKKTDKLHRQAILIEDMGDEGDSFDYSYPTEDWQRIDDLGDATVNYKTSPYQQILTLEGTMTIPHNLQERAQKVATSPLTYRINLILEDHSPIVHLTGVFHNQADQHRVRLIFTGEQANKVSYAGTQYSVIERPTYDPAHKDWREKNYFEEPSSIYALLNHVSAVHTEGVQTVYTRSSKEYEFVGEGYKDIGVTIFRAYGALGYPDLNRRPGRPSGVDYHIFETPKCQMIGDNSFDLGLSYDSDFDENRVFTDYVMFATDTSVYQQQAFNHTVNPIDYFPTNPLETALPRDYHFLEIKEGEGVFGTLVKSDKEAAYLLRLFNASVKLVPLGRLEGVVSGGVLSETNLGESQSRPLTTHFQPGELKVIKVEKGEI